MVSKLLDICEFIIDCEHKTAPTVSESEYLSIRTPNIGKGYFILNGVNKVSKSTYEKWTRRGIPRKNDLIIAREAPVGNVAIIKKSLNMCLGQRTVLIRPDSTKVSPQYLCYLLLSDLIQNQIHGNSTGATVAHLNMKDIRNLKLPQLPDMPIQEQIAFTVSTYDELIDINNERIKLLDETALDFYKEWFVRMRFPGYKNVRFVKGTPIDWQIEKIGNILELAYGKALKEDCRIVGDFPVYGSSGIIGYHNEGIVKAPGIVVGRKGNVGSVHWVNKDFYPIDTVFYVKSSISLYYLYYNLQGQNFIEGDAAVPGLNRNQAYSNYLFIPSEEILKKFENIVKPLVDLSTNLEQQNIQLRETRDRLLPRLISGKLRVKPHTEFDKTESTESGNPFFRRRVLAAHIIDRLKDEPTFGHVKLMKLMYLCEHLAEIETASHYHRDAAGPYDNRMIRSIDSQLKKAQWFECKKIGNKYQYTALPKKEEYKSWFTNYYSDKEAGIENLLHLFGKEKTEKAEMVATLYGAWLYLKERKQLSTDQAIIYEVLNNWDESKQRISEERWLKCLQWMKEKNWIT